ncbi:unnamed protein product [Linum tenue]|uniref:ATP-dependent Clp protease proteolytic subunit n=1 Tax=Linum tenue TaxID=586396 RepID=A0AAV0S1V0_9ROSI|nr:unnamed protein product [Linum tenue]
MESGLPFAAAASSQSATPLFFSNHAFIHQQFPSPLITRNGKSSKKLNNGGRRNLVSVKALNSSSRSGITSRRTLSSNWDTVDFSSFAASAPRLPRFEELDTTNMLLRQRIVFLGSEGILFNLVVTFLNNRRRTLILVAVRQVDDMSADFIISQLLFLDAEDPTKDIRMFINSPGGSVTAGMGIYDAMKVCKADVSTICIGLAASMGALVLAGGTQGKRFCMPNGRVMIHQPHGTAGGKASEMSIRIREMNYHRIKINKILSRATGKPVEQIEVDTDRDNYMDAWEAKSYGLVDGVIDDGKPGLVAPIADASPPPKTRIWEYWKVEGTKQAKKSLPSEHRILQKAYSNGVLGADENEGNEKDEPAPSE